MLMTAAGLTFLSAICAAAALWPRRFRSSRGFILLNAQHAEGITTYLLGKMTEAEELSYRAGRIEAAARAIDQNNTEVTVKKCLIRASLVFASALVVGAVFSWVLFSRTTPSF